MHSFKSVYAMVHALRPEHPVYCLRPSAVTIATRWFLDNFPGRVLYAVKTNPDFVGTIAEAGLAHFDAASLGEIELVHRTAPHARISFMHPVKSRQAIRRAYFQYGVRDFSLDSEAELNKILEETRHADDLNLFVRLSVSNQHSKYSLAGKFGIAGKAAAKLLFKARQHADKLGICFHAGSQIMNPDAFRIAMHDVSQLIIRSSVIIDILDVGGGFPSVYPGMIPPPLEKYLKVITDSFEESLVSETCELWCEPGRALVAEGASLVVKVELRKDNDLYLNDGTYGGLFDAGQPAMVFPVHQIRPGATHTEMNSVRQMDEFSFYGPTCDSIDAMPGPFELPADIAEGDYIEVDNMGAYSISMRTGFNHFNVCEQVIVDTQPRLSMYGQNEYEVPVTHVMKKHVPNDATATKTNTTSRDSNVKSLIKENSSDAS